VSQGLALAVGYRADTALDRQDAFGETRLVSEPELAAKFDCPRVSRLEAVGALFENNIAKGERLQRAAESHAALEQFQFRVRQELMQSMRRGESGHAAADNGEAKRRRR
jgi:hypothetical protein